MVDVNKKSTVLLSVVALVIAIFPIKYLINQFIIVQEANDDIDTEEM